MHLSTIAKGEHLATNFEELAKKIPIIKKDTSNEKYLLFVLLNKTTLTGKDLSMAVFEALKADPTFLGYGELKAITMSTSFSDEEIVLGNVRNQLWTYHPYVIISNKTTPEEYWDLVNKNIIRKFIDNSYEQRVPRFFVVRIKNVDKFKNTNIKESLNPKTGKRSIGISKFNTPQKRDFHTTSVQFNQKTSYLTLSILFFVLNPSLLLNSKQILSIIFNCLLETSYLTLSNLFFVINPSFLLNSTQILSYLYNYK